MAAVKHFEELDVYRLAMELQQSAALWRMPNAGAQVSKNSLRLSRMIGYGKRAAMAGVTANSHTVKPLNKITLSNRHEIVAYTS